MQTWDGTLFTVVAIVWTIVAGLAGTLATYYFMNRQEIKQSPVRAKSPLPQPLPFTLRISPFDVNPQHLAPTLGIPSQYKHTPHCSSPLLGLCKSPAPLSAMSSSPSTLPNNALVRKVLAKLAVTDSPVNKELSSLYSPELNLSPDSSCSVSDEESPGFDGLTSSDLPKFVHKLPEDENPSYVY